MLLFLCICIIIAAILLILYSIHQALVVAPRKRALAQHYQLSRRLYERGTSTNSLSTARECYTQLHASYTAIEKDACQNSRTCFADDLREIRDYAEDLAQEQWNDKAQTYLWDLERLYASVMAADCQSIQQARKDSARLLKLYDAYWEWTRKCHEDNATLWSRINLWNLAKQAMADTLGSGFSYHDSRTSVRAQLERRLTRHIASLQPMAPPPIRKQPVKQLPPKPETPAHSYDAVLRRFKEEHIPYVDKTSAGGGLYFFSQDVANDLTAQGYPVQYARNGTKGTGHRPAWYIKFP